MFGCAYLYVSTLTRACFNLFVFETCLTVLSHALSCYPTVTRHCQRLLATTHHHPGPYVFRVAALSYAWLSLCVIKFAQLWLVILTYP